MRFCFVHSVFFLAAAALIISGYGPMYRERKSAEAEYAKVSARREILAERVRRMELYRDSLIGGESMAESMAIREHLNLGRPGEIGLGGE